MESNDVHAENFFIISLFHLYLFSCSFALYYTYFILCLVTFALYFLTNLLICSYAVSILRKGYQYKNIWIPVLQSKLDTHTPMHTNAMHQIILRKGQAMSLSSPLALPPLFCIDVASIRIFTSFLLSCIDPFIYIAKVLPCGHLKICSVFHIFLFPLSHSHILIHFMSSC